VLLLPRLLPITPLLSTQILLHLHTVSVVQALLPRQGFAQGLGQLLVAIVVAVTVLLSASVLFVAMA
jgi:hypothetical protein